MDAVAEVCGRAGRDPASVQLVAVSKTVSADRLVVAVAAGLTLLGENRVQEAEAKAPRVAGARWHLIGPLQSNKARRAVELFETIESVDSLELARRLDRLAGEIALAPRAMPAALGIYLQVNVDRDAAKAGFLPEALEAELPALAGLSNLSLLGLMTVGRLAGSPEEARPTFVRLRELSERLRARDAGPGRRAFDGHVGRLHRCRGGGRDAHPRRPGALRTAARRRPGSRRGSSLGAMNWTIALVADGRSTAIIAPCVQASTTQIVHPSR